MVHGRSTTVLAALLFALFAPAAQADGDLDLDFGSAGAAVVVPPPDSLDTGRPVVLAQADGRILVFGITTVQRLIYGKRLERDGTPDPSFVFEDPWPSNLGRLVGGLILADGRIAVAATFNPAGSPEPGLVVWMLRPDGAFDPDFGFGGWRTYELPFESVTVSTIAAGPSGTILVGSYGFHPGPFAGRDMFGITRLLIDGSLDASWHPSGTRIHDWRPSPDADDKSTLKRIAVEPDGRLLLAGYLFNASFGTSVGMVGRLTGGGVFDTGFGFSGRTIIDWSIPGLPAGVPQPFGLVRLASGELLVGANLFSIDLALSYFGTAKLSSAGVIDANWGDDGFTRDFFDGGESVGTDLRIDRSGALVLAGRASFGDSEDAYGVMRFSRNGAPDLTFQGDGIQVYSLNPGTQHDGTDSMVLHSDGGILLAGLTPIPNGAGGEMAAIVVLRLGGGLPFSDGLESGGTGFWSAP